MPLFRDAPRRRTTFAWTLLVLALLWPSRAAAQSGEEVVYYHTDAVGSVRMTTGPGGAVIERFDFQPFGAPIPGTAPTTPDVRQFAGKEQDTAAGLDYFGARYYAGGLGRFTSVDPVLDVGKALGDPQRWNRYAYALNNPLQVIDPDGRDPLPTAWNLGAGADGLLRVLPAVGKTLWNMAVGLNSPGHLSAEGERAQQARLMGPSSAEESAIMQFTGLALLIGPLARGMGVSAGYEAAIELPATTPVGKLGSPLGVVHGTNTPTTISGRVYTGHALDRMQGRGLLPSVVEDTIARGTTSQGRKGAIIYTTEQARVVLNPDGSVKTVMLQ